MSKFRRGLKGGNGATRKGRWAVCKITTEALKLVAVGLAIPVATAGSFTVVSAHGDGVIELQRTIVERRR
jgi:hypothetical protein